MAAVVDGDAGGAIGLDDDLDSLLGGFLDAWAQRWEQEFQRRSAAEDAFLARRVEKVNLRVGQSEDSYVAAVNAAVKEEDETARRISSITKEVQAAQHAHKVAELRHDAAHNRQSVMAEAFRDADDAMRSITENAAKRRLEREAKRREEKRKREEEMEARWRQQREQSAASGCGGAKEAGQQRRPSNSPNPPRFTRLPTGGADGGGRGSGGGGKGVSMSAADALAAAVKAGRGFDAFDAAWAEFERRAAGVSAAGSAASLSYADVPFPTALPTVSGVTDSDTLEVRKRKLKAAVLRWHPDKWSPLLDKICETDRAQVVEEVKKTTRRILEERKRFLR